MDRGSEKTCACISSDPANVAACGQTMSDSGGLTLQAVHSSCVPQTYEELHVYNASSGVESCSELGERQSLENVNRAPPAPRCPLPRAPSGTGPTSTPPVTLGPWRPQPAPLQSNRGLQQQLWRGVSLEYEQAPLTHFRSAHPRPGRPRPKRPPGDQRRSGDAPADDNPRGPTVACVSDSSSSSTTEDEASDMEGEAQLDEPVEDQGIDNAAFIGNRPAAQRSLSALEEGEETCMVVGEGGLETPHSADSVASYAFDMTASNSNSHSTADGCPKSPGIFSLEELPKEDKDQSVIQELTLPSPQLQPGSAEPLVSSSGEQHYMHCGDVDAELGDRNDVKPLDTVLFVAPQHPGGGPCDTQPPYYSIICDNTENSPSGNV
ncbi:hypothetical protein DPEC_G00368980 [Dallia pectoralis]|nr:hypothetical protein DPEC_G00368980 [Dallia pectoralis]